MFYNGLQTPTAIIVAVHTTVNGTAIITLNTGETDSAALLTTTDNGWGRLEIESLTPNTRYTYTVTIPDGTGGSGEITTYKDDGGECLAFYSCEMSNSDGASAPALQQMVQQGAKSIISLGDECYDEQIVWALKADTQDVDKHHDWHHDMRVGRPQKMKVAKQVGFGGLADDHDTFINGIWNDQADPPAGLNANLAAVGRSYTFTAAEWDTCLANIGASLWAIQRCNPQHRTVSADTDPLYFSFEAGNMLVIVPALVMWTKTTMRDDHDGTNPIMNAEQYAWLQSQISNTSKKFKVIISQKMTVVATNSEPDDWADYSDMATVLSWISSDSGNWAVPGGVIWGSGDWHSPGIGAFNSVADAYDHVIINACPSGRFNDVRDPGAALSTTKELIRANEVDDNRFLNYGLVTSTDNYVEIAIKLFDGSTYSKARVNAGENKIAAFIPQAVAI